MKCETARQLISEHADNLLDHRRLLLLEEHLACCSSCLQYHQMFVEQIHRLGLYSKGIVVRPLDDDGVAGKVINRLEYQRQGDTKSLFERVFGASLAPSAAFAALFFVLTVAFTLVFHGMLSTAPYDTPELRSGRQFAYTARVEDNGRIKADVCTRKFARLQTPESRWAR